MSISKFPAVPEHENHMVDAALDGLRRVRSSWLRDPDVVAVDVGYYLHHGEPVDPESAHVYYGKDVDGVEGRLSPGDLALLGVPPEKAADCVKVPIADAELPEGVTCDPYGLPWIRVHVNRKLTPYELKGHHLRPYHKSFIEEDGREFAVHVVEALYEPMTRRFMDPDIDEAFNEFCDALLGTCENKFAPRSESATSPVGGDRTEVRAAVNRIEEALNKRFITESLEGSDIDSQQVVVPLTGGISIGNTRHQVGTIGAIVWDKTDCKPCILSCWHVLDGGGVQIGEPCLQPAMRDGGHPTWHTVGHLKRSQVGRNVDAALAELTGSRSYSAGTILCGCEGSDAVNIAGVSEEPNPMLLGTEVWKCGRATGVTEGLIDGVGLSLSLEFFDGSAEIFHNQLHILPLPEGGESDLTKAEVSQAGDSGALWLDEQRRAVGLNFAGDTTNSPLGDFAIANRMTDVAREMNISLTPVFLHPHELAEQQREALVRAAIVALQERAANVSSQDVAESLAEILSWAAERVGRGGGSWTRVNLDPAAGPIGQPGTWPPGGGGSGAGPIGQPGTWPPGGGSGAGAVGQPQTRPPGGGRRG